MTLLYLIVNKLKHPIFTVGGTTSFYGRTTVEKHIWENILENEGHAGVYWKVTLVIYKKKPVDIFSQHLKACLNGFNIWFNMRSTLC